MILGKKTGHGDADFDEIGDDGALAFLTSETAKQLVDNIIEETSPANDYDHDGPYLPPDIDTLSVASDDERSVESLSQLVENVLHTANKEIGKEYNHENEYSQQSSGVTDIQALPDNEQIQREHRASLLISGRPSLKLDPSDGLFPDIQVSPDTGFTALINDTVNGVMNDDASDAYFEGPDIPNSSQTAQELVENVLSSIDGTNFDDDAIQSSSKETTTNAQNLVDDVLNDVMHDSDVEFDYPPTPPSIEPNKTTDSANELVRGIIDQVDLNGELEGYED